MAKFDKILDPLERFSEIMFGLIMALTFTCSISVATSSRNDVVTMLAAALSCNVAWGLVDAAMYVLNQVIARRECLGTATRILTAPDSRAREIVLEQLPVAAASVLAHSELDRIVNAVRTAAPSAGRTGPARDDLIGAVGVFALVLLSTLPVALPFLVFSDVALALRISNATAVVMLYLIGARLAWHIGWHPSWRVGAGVALFGAILVAVTIALGG